MAKIIEQDGKKFLVIGDKAVPFESVDANGNPIINVETETILSKHGQDVIVKVPCLQVTGKGKL